jgi:hypothetical protein
MFVHGIVKHLLVLQWARINGCHWDQGAICVQAAQNGHLDVLKWARAMGCPWGSSYNFNVYTIAVRNDHLELLQWARANGCPWDYHTFRIATSKCAGNWGSGSAAAKWAIDNGCREAENR